MRKGRNKVAEKQRPVKVAPDDFGVRLVARKGSIPADIVLEV